MKSCFLFPGQGAQYPGMAKDIYDTSQETRKLFELASEACGTDMKKLLFESDETVLKETRNTQIAMALAEVAAALCAKEHGLIPSGCAGFFCGRMACPCGSPGNQLLRHVPSGCRARKAYGRSGKAFRGLLHERRSVPCP